MKKSIEIHITGPRVQGVGFRYFIWDRANNLGIKGFVKNEPDGSVLVEAEGEEKILDRFVNYIKKGPTMAIIHNVSVQDIPAKNYKDFRIKR